MENRKKNSYMTTLDNYIKSVRSPDIGMETHLDSHSMYNYIWSVKSLVATVNTKYHNLGFPRGFDYLVHVTLQDGPGRTVDTAPGELTHVTHNEGSITLVQGDSITAARPKNN